MSHPTTPLSYRMFDIDGTNLVEKPILTQGHYISAEDFEIIKQHYAVSENPYNDKAMDIDYINVQEDGENYAVVVEQNDGTFYIDYVD